MAMLLRQKRMLFDGRQSNSTVSSSTRLWRLLPRQIRLLPPDLAGVIIIVLLTLISVFVPVINKTPLRIIVGLPFVLFVPGYALIAALFPEAGGPSGGEQSAGEATSQSGIDRIERVALSFGTSIAVVPLVGLVLNFTPFGIRLAPIMIALSGLTLTLAIVGARRRWHLPEEERFRVPYKTLGSQIRTEMLEPESRWDAALNVLLVISLLLAVSSVGYAVAVPKQGEKFTEFYLLTESDDGELVADNYPTEFVAGESRSLVVGVGNHEHQPQNYTVVATIQRVKVRNNSTVILAQRELTRFQTRIDHNETWQLQHTVSPEMTGTDLRLQYLLYRGSPASDLDSESAYRELHLWVNVSSPQNSLTHPVVV